MKAFIDKVAICAPGLDGWEKSSSVLTGSKNLQPHELERYKPLSLPRNEQRRASDTVRMAFRIGEEIGEHASSDLADCASVFASSGGDYSIVHQICETLCTRDKLISPTQFHNSVHNAPAGYWAIATGSHQASVSLSAYDDTFISGLLEAMTMVKADQIKVLLIAYDAQPPFPLCNSRKITMPFATGMLLSPIATANSKCKIQLDLDDRSAGLSERTLPASPMLKELFESNPIAQCLPMLEHIAANRKGQVIYKPASFGKDGGITLNLTPC